ncbi:putative membrane protein, partial [Vibrio parahaemolyticus VP2007-007]
RRN